MKLWTGRFSKEIDPKTNDFNSSIKFDSRMYKEDITGSMAHATMLGAQGINSKEDTEAILAGLQGILDDIESGALEIDPNAEDIHTFVEQTLTERIGSAGKRLHTSRSRNDQVALDDRLTIRNECDALIPQLKELIAVLAKQAAEHAEDIMPSYTHLQYDIDREMTAKALGFDGPCRNSLDGVSDRDFCIEFASALSLVMVHLSRFSEEICMWCSWEFKFIELDDAFSTGSSIMPQKKNPDIAELVRGKSGRVFGDLTTLLTVMKGLPLAYNKDMQEDKEAIFDAFDTVKMCLTAFIPMIDTMTVLPQNMRKAAAGGFINATDCADYLVGRGLPFRDAYKCTGELVALCIEKGTTLEELPLEEYRKVCDLFEEGVYDAISLERCVSQRTCIGAPAPENVRAEAARVAALVAE